MKKKFNQHKLKISKQQKRLFITILIILLLVNIGLIMNEVINKETREETQISSSFSNTPGISYQVYLKENALYDDTVQPEEIGYFPAFLDYIEVTFEDKYLGVDGTEFKGDYTITGEITGWEGGSEVPVPAWTKKFVICPKKNFSTTDDKMNLAQSTKIDYNHFNAFVTEIGKLTGYITTYSMKVVMVVNYTISTEEGDVEGSLQPSLTMPLGESYFKIAKSGIEEKKDNITKNVEIPVPVDYIKISLFSTFSLLCLVLMIIFISSAEPTLTDLQRKRVRKMFKAQGHRLVAVYDNYAAEALTICNVHSMSDLIKISDEIERPILYVFQNDPADIKEFFLFENEKAYRYQVRDRKDTSNKKTDPVKSEVSTESGDGVHTVIV